MTHSVSKTGSLPRVAALVNFAGLCEDFTIFILAVVQHDLAGSIEVREIRGQAIRILVRGEKG